MVAGAPHGAAARGAPSAQTGQRPGGQDAPPSGAGQPAPAEQHGAPEWYRTKRCHPDGPQPASDAAPAGPAGVPGAAESVGADVSDNFRKAMQVLANPPYTVVLNESSVKALKALVGSGSVGEQKPPAGEGAEKEGAKGEPPAAPTVADLEATVSRLTTELERVGNEARMLEYSRGNPSSLDQTRPGAGYVMDPLREQMDRARAREADITRKLTEAQAALAKARNEAAAKDAKGIGEGLLASENALAKAEGKRGTQEELADAEAAKRAAEVALENAGSSAGEALRQKLQTAVNTATVQVANLKAQLAKEGVERVAKAMPEWEKHWKRWGDRLWNIPRDRQAMEKYAKAFWEEFNTKAFGEQTRAKAFAKMWKGLTLKGADGKPAPLSGALQSVGDWAGRVGVDVLGTMGIRLRTERRKGEVGTPRDLRRAGAVMSALPVIASTAAGIGQAPDKKTGAMTGAMGLASAGWMVGMQWGKTAGLYGAVAGAVIGGVAGLLFGGNEARKQAEREAQRMRAAQLEELRRINNSLAPVSDYFRGMSLNLLPPSMTFGGGGVAQSYAVISQRGARA